MTQIDAKKIAADWAERGFTCDFWVDLPGQHWENFAHEVDELVLVVEGTMEFEWEGNVYQPKIGQELLIPARTVHASRNRGTTRAIWLYGYRTLDS